MLIQDRKLSYLQQTEIVSMFTYGNNSITCTAHKISHVHNTVQYNETCLQCMQFQISVIVVTCEPKTTRKFIISSTVVLCAACVAILYENPVKSMITNELKLQSIV